MFLPSLCLAALALASPGWCACTTNSPYVGLEGALTMMEHKVGGRIRILDDCSFQVTDFTYDGKAPAAYWYGAPSTEPRDIRDQGFRLNEMRLERHYTGEEVTILLNPGISWDAVPVISVWCEEFAADFGHLDLKALLAEKQAESPPPVASPPPFPELAAASPAAAAPTAAAMPPGASSDGGAVAVDGSGMPMRPSPLSSVSDLANCLELKPGYYNLHWEVMDGMLLLGLEGRNGGDNRWMGFGFSQPNATDVLMPGSDAIVGGMVNGECFAYSYFLEQRAQCSYVQNSGVCPTFGLTSEMEDGPQDDPLELLACEKVGDVLSLLVMRPLNLSGPFFISWPLDGSRFTVWAMGPVSEGSNASLPVVLYHRFTLPGESEDTIVHAPLGKGFTVHLGHAHPPEGCRPLATVGAPAPAQAPSMEGKGPSSEAAERILEGVSVFNVTIGDNPNYPNPPGWGISFHINDMETPVLMVKRGTTYTFRVMAGPTHPLYITTSIIGGGSLNDNQGETVFAGGDFSAGTPEEPFVLEWTPDSATPDLVYYQCDVHQKLGWQIRVSD